MVAAVEGDFGKLDILCNNVGIQHVAPLQDFPEDKWDAIMDICLNSTFHATKAALPGMLQRGWGRIINTGSMHALVASPYKSAYNAAKHGVVRNSSLFEKITFEQLPKMGFPESTTHSFRLQEAGAGQVSFTALGRCSHCCLLLKSKKGPCWTCSNNLCQCARGLASSNLLGNESSM